VPYYKKPYLTLPGQVALLRRRGMLFRCEKKATGELQKIGYYRLSAYWYPFRSSVDPMENLENLKSDVSFQTVLKLYLFDKKLRSHMLVAIESIEIALRTQIAISLGKQYPWAHRCPKFMNDEFLKRTDGRDHITWRKKQDERFQSSKEEFVKHFKKKYHRSKPPIWIDIDTWEFGSMTVFFSGLKTNDQAEISQKFGITNPKTFRSWIACINHTRNVCAHHGRLWNKPLINRPSFKDDSGELFYFNESAITPDRFYAAAALIRHLLHHIDSKFCKVWQKDFKKIVKSFPKDKYINLSQAGFPNNWNKHSIWKNNLFS
jgi:abortive infection bacteriophage resistance protein